MGIGKVRGSCGQATVELAVALPVVIAVAVIAVNALLFFGECAAFDRVSSQAVRAYAASPAYGQDTQRSCALVKAALDRQFSESYLDVSVSAGNAGSGKVRFTSTLTFHPTLFGLGLKSRVFGVELPSLRHSSALAVSVYKPGVLL